MSSEMSERTSNAREKGQTLQSKKEIDQLSAKRTARLTSAERHVSAEEKSQTQKNYNEIKEAVRLTSTGQRVKRPVRCHRGRQMRKQGKKEGIVQSKH